MLDEKPPLDEPRFSPSRTFCFFLREDVGKILNLGPFNHARSVLAHFRFFLLSLRTRFLILMANGMSEALRQLVLSCLETVCASVLCIAWSAKQQDREQREREPNVHDKTSHVACRGHVYQSWSANLTVSWIS